MVLIGTHLNAEVIPLLPPPPYTLPPFSPSLISLVVCVDVKHHVYLLAKWKQFIRTERLHACFAVTCHLHFWHNDWAVCDFDVLLL